MKVFLSMALASCSEDPTLRFMDSVSNKFSSLLQINQDSEIAPGISQQDMNNKNLILNQLLNEKGGDEIAVKLLQKDHFKQQDAC